MAESKTSLTLTYAKKEFPVPVGFTAEEYMESLAVTFPELATAKLIDDGGGKFTAKPLYGEKG